VSEHAIAADGLGDLLFADGPWDYSKAPSDATFLDFGPLKVVRREGLKARLEADPIRGKVGAVSIKVNDAEVQLQVITAPAGQSYWSVVRKQLLAKLRASPGSQQAVEGKFGPEIIATIVERGRDGILADSTMRLVGVDGDRWLLRAVVVGPGATSDATVERVDALLSQCAVERGTEALGAGTVLPLRPPAGVNVNPETPPA
jgi:hypothetical protein